MSTLDQLSGDRGLREALAAHGARLKHDLGKYVALQQRWLGPGAAAGDLLDALRADLLSTRRGPDGTVDAAAVWAEFRPVLYGEAELMPGARVDLSGDPDVERIDSAMKAIAGRIDTLEGSPDPVVLAELTEAALEVSEGCRALARRLGEWLGRVDG